MYRQFIGVTRFIVVFLVLGVILLSLGCYRLDPNEGTEAELSTDAHAAIMPLIGGPFYLGDHVSNIASERRLASIGTDAHLSSSNACREIHRTSTGWYDDRRDSCVVSVSYPSYDKEIHYQEGFNGQVLLGIKHYYEATAGYWHLYRPSFEDPDYRYQWSYLRREDSTEETIRYNVGGLILYMHDDEIIAEFRIQEGVLETSSTHEILTTQYPLVLKIKHGNRQYRYDGILEKEAGLSSLVAQLKKNGDLINFWIRLSDNQLSFFKKESDQEVPFTQLN
ncbi:hypothetical protein DID77_03985 [Candidatus Marinamargulisbacteria bacterium SCGC AG-439-L15]|nr:hypothetical protein DID77_03985 [Candidatus Marinamargulisbacteria bacterium SCGC AG-439-L15]